MDNAEYIWRYPCRNCGKAAREGHACCSSKCRSQVPTCEKNGCKNVTEHGFNNGVGNWSQYCRKHGGKVLYDHDPRDFGPQSKIKYFLTRSRVSD